MFYLVLMVAVATTACSSSELSVTEIDGGTGTGGNDGSTPTEGGPGGACSCDSDCPSEGANAGACIYGVCMTRATMDCPNPGSQDGCPAGSRCWGLSNDNPMPLCWPDCAAHACSGTCDSDGSCAPSETGDCNPTCGAACSCTETSCPMGESCVGGSCIETVSGGPGPGPGPACPDLPARDCTGANCGQIVTFDPRTNAAWDDYAINGETEANQYRSYLRRDLQMLVSYATSKVACKAARWEGGNGGPLGLGDMSEMNGAIPGTSIGEPGHPANTHTNGYDIDLGYYQKDTANNRLRPICAHTNGGADQYHCVSAPDKLDVWRHALFLGSIFESARTRVIGVDGQAGPQLMSAMQELCSTGWLEPASCNNIALAYETTDEGLGWYQFHHHHSHISLERASLQAPTHPGCADESCTPRVKARPGREPGVHRLR